MKGRHEELDNIEAVNEAFRDEVATFGFHYRCGSCVHVHRGTRSCSLGYPNGFLLGPRTVIHADGNLTFCKYFELGETTEDLG